MPYLDHFTAITNNIIFIIYYYCLEKNLTFKIFQIYKIKHFLNKSF